MARRVSPSAMPGSRADPESCKLRRMTLPSDVKRVERTRAAEREARVLPDDELEGRLAAADHEIAELRQRLEEINARRDALEAEKDRRAIQRRAG
jgi:uncharacterized protein YceH (UPF0502 family)